MPRRGRTNILTRRKYFQRRTSHILDATPLMRRDIFVRDFPKGKGTKNKGNKKRHHSHIIKYEEPAKNKAKEESSGDE